MAAGSLDKLVGVRRKGEGGGGRGGEGSGGRGEGQADSSAMIE